MNNLNIFRDYCRKVWAKSIIFARIFMKPQGKNGLCGVCRRRFVGMLFQKAL